MAIDSAKREAFRGVLQKMIDDGAPEEVITEATAKFKAKYDAPEASPETAVPAPESQISSPPNHGGSALFPSASRIEGSGAGANAARAGLGALDLLGAPMRALATTRGMTMSDPGAYLFRPEAEAVGNAYRSRGSEIAAEAAAMPSQTGAEKWAQGNAFQRSGMANAAGSSAEIIGQAVSDPLSVGLAAIKAAGAAARIALQVAGKTVGGLNKVAGFTAAKATGVPVEALRAAGSPYGRARMAQNFGREKEIGDALLTKIDNADEFIPERAIVDASLEKMGDLPIQPAIDALEGAKGASVAGRLSPEKAAANTAIGKYVDFLKGGSDDIPTSVSAKEYRKLRQDLDVPVDWDAEGALIKNNALKAGRTTMKNELLKKAEESGDPKYAEAMKSWSNKLDKIERIKGLLGKTGTARDKRVEQFVSTLFGRNNTYKTQLLNDIDEVFKTNIVSRAKAADMAKKFGESGKPGLLPVYGTGGSTSAAVNFGLTLPRAAAVALTGGTASPLIASRITLPLLTSLEKTLKAGQIKLSPKAVNAIAALKKPLAETQKVRLANILAAELEAQMPANVIPFQIKKTADNDEDSSTITMRGTP